jgi:hypothetical protein
VWTLAVQQTARLFDYLVGAGEQRDWDGEAKGLLADLAASFRDDLKQQLESLRQVFRDDGTLLALVVRDRGGTTIDFATPRASNSLANANPMNEVFGTDKGRRALAVPTVHRAMPVAV